MAYCLIYLFFLFLFQSVLGYEVRKKGSPHNCLDDACAAMKLVLAKVERGVGDTIPSAQEDVSVCI
jgi:RNA exonuclease 1